MRIKCLEIANFRRLESVRIDLSVDTTLLVGANNSGKTSAMEALRKFLVRGAEFRLSDITLSHLPALRAVGERWEKSAGLEPLEGPGQRTSGSDDGGELGLHDILPHLDIWIEVDEGEHHRVSELIPILDDFCGGVGVRRRLEPKNLAVLKRDYLEGRRAVIETLNSVADGADRPRLWPANLVEFIERRIHKYFEVKSYRLDPRRLVGPVAFVGGKAGLEPEEGKGRVVPRPQAVEAGRDSIDRSVLDKLIRVDVVPAQRSLVDDASSTSLTDSIAAYYRDHLDFTSGPTPDDLEAILAAQSASATFEKHLGLAFRGPFGEVASVGYPGTVDPQPIVSVDLQLADGLAHESVLRYRVGIPEVGQDPTMFDLPEGLNGLGYQNLVLMMFRLMGFRDKRMRIGRAAERDGSGLERAPIHLVLIEEPEAHLHPQVQQVFVRRAHNILSARFGAGSGDGLTTQLVVSTHSSHIAHELAFEKLRYFCRVAPSKGKPVSTTAVKSLALVFGSDDVTARFVKRYLMVSHCNLFFADAAVLLEGAAERILMPHFVKRWHAEIAQCYVEYLDVGGAHAHRLKPLLDELEIPTLVVTDIDAAGEDGKKARPQRGMNQKSTSDALRLWLEASDGLDDLLNLDDEAKVASGLAGVGARFAYQLEVDAAVAGFGPVKVVSRVKIGATPIS